MSDAAYRVDGDLVPSARFYTVACDPRRSVVVEACAGAGKTWMLVSRIVRALLDGCEPQQILAITFTRKAAGEMRDRLDEWLASWSVVHADDARRVDELVLRGASRAEAESLAPALGQLHERLLACGRVVEVRSFHAWFAQLLSHAPLSLLQRLQLPAAYELLEDPRQWQAVLFRSFWQRVHADAALVSDVHALVQRHRRSTLEQWLVAAWLRGAEFRRADAAGAVDTAVPSAAQCWASCAGGEHPIEQLRAPEVCSAVEALARALGAIQQKAPQTAAQGLVEGLAQTEPSATLAMWRAALFTDKGEGPPRKLKLEGPVIQGVLDLLEGLQTQIDQHEAHEDQVRLARLTRVLLDAYDTLKRRQGLVDMNDLEAAAATLLGDAEVSGWVQERLDQQLRHVLIDEFQDTSPLQWQVLSSWLSAYAGAGGGGSGQHPLRVFVVGDPKQSIYRFRGAEPRVFGAAREFIQNSLDGAVLSCDHTRRNAPAVIDVLNQVFEAAQAHEGWGPFRAHTTAAQHAGQVLRLEEPSEDTASAAPAALAATRGLPQPTKLALDAEGPPAHWRSSLTTPRVEAEVHRKALEAQRVAQAVQAALAQGGFPPGEVMVLARRRSTLSLVAEALAAAGVPHVVAEPLRLDESPEALDLVALLDALASPAHDLSLARALKSPLFGASDADLLDLAEAARHTRSWRAALLREAGWSSPALARAAVLIATWLQGLAAAAPHELLDRIVSEGEVLARFAAAVPAARWLAAQQAVHALLAGALAWQGGRFVALYSFVRALRAGQVPAVAHAPAAAVQLLTVHGAKGLEAQVVVLADTDSAPRRDDSAQVLVDWPVEADAPRAFAFLRSSRPAPSLRPTLDEAAAAAAREELNALYVAITRAKAWLVFSRTPPAKRSSGATWWSRASAAAQPWRPAAAIGAADPAAAAQHDEARVAVLPALTAPAPAPDPRDAADKAAARLGEAVHRVLEWAGQPGQDLAAFDIEAASTAAAQAFGLMASSRPKVAVIARRILRSPSAARFFGGEALRWAGNEVPLASGDKTLRVDRLVALDGSEGRIWWVLDYKLSHHPEQMPAYQAQMAQYVALVQALQPGDAVRGAFITGQGEVVEAG